MYSTHVGLFSTAIWVHFRLTKTIATATINMLCPCCENLRTIEQVLEAPVIFLQQIGKCKICKQQLKLDEERIEYLENSDGKAVLTVQGRLSCSLCLETRSHLSLSDETPSSFLDQKELFLSISENNLQVIPRSSRSKDLSEDKVSHNFYGKTVFINNPTSTVKLEKFQNTEEEEEALD